MMSNLRTSTKLVLLLLVVLWGGFIWATVGLASPSAHGNGEPVYIGEGFDLDNPNGDMISFWGCEAFTVGNVEAVALPDYGSPDCEENPTGFVWELEHPFSSGTYQVQGTNAIRTTYPRTDSAVITTYPGLGEKIFGVVMGVLMTAMVFIMGGLFISLDSHLKSTQSKKPKKDAKKK